jgi:hypothetical protein
MVRKNIEGRLLDFTGEPNVDEFFILWLQNVPAAQLDVEYRRATIALLRSDIPLADYRQALAEELESIFLPLEWHARMRQVRARVYRAFIERAVELGLSKAKARARFAEGLGFSSPEALKQFLRRESKEGYKDS